MPDNKMENILAQSIITAPPEELRVECVVIGSGAGGALTAAFLAARGKEVLVIEEGPFAEYEEGAYGIRDTFPRVWREGGAIPIMSNASLLFAEGRCLGGSTMINAGLIHRVSEEVADEWRRDFQIKDFEYAELMRYQEEVERSLSAEIRDDSSNPASKILRRGAEICGFKGYQVPVAAREVSGRLRKSTMPETFLRWAAERGARFLTDCRVEKIEFRKDTAVSLTALRHTKEGMRRVRIRFAKLFVCAGTIQTPLLLRRSGVKKNIGNSVQFHPTLRVLAEFPEPIHAEAHFMPSFQIKEFAPTLTMGASMTDTAFIASALSLDWAHQKRMMERADRMAIFYVGVKSKGRGVARNIPFGGGSYLVRYPLYEEDMKHLGFGYAKLCELLFAAGATRLYPAIAGVGAIVSDVPAQKYLIEPLPLKKVNLVTIHSYGSCPIGENKTFAALDSHGKVHDLANVYVNDASMLPTSPGVNPQGPLMALALRNMEHNFEII